MLPDLLTFQRGFAEAIGHPVTGPLAVYRNTIVGGAVEALRDNYPVVEQIVGEDMFDAVAADFAVASPPESPVLALYGADFAEWLRQQRWIGQLPYLPDLAKVERLHVECLFAADVEAFSIDPGMATDKLYVHLHPAVRFDWLRSPAMRIWIAHQDGPPSDLELEWEAEGALFTRPGGLPVQPVLLDRAAHRLLFGIRLGETVGTAMKAAARLYPAADLGIVLTSLVGLGAFAAPAAERTWP